MFGWGIFGIGLIIGYIFWILRSYATRKSDECDERRRRYNGKGYPIPSNIYYEKKYELNSRGMLLHQTILYPKQYIPSISSSTLSHSSSPSSSSAISSSAPVPPLLQGVILICHGFGDHTHDFALEIALKFCTANYAVLTMDAEGHGLSDGLHGHIDSLETIAQDYSNFLILQSQRIEFQSQKFFVYGGSMGGAVAFYLSTQFPSKDLLSGVILASPMVKISEEMRPHPLLITLLTLVGRFFPYAPWVPSQNISEKCFKRKDNLFRSLACLLSYKQSPRLATATQLLHATDQITSKMSDFSLPLLLLHGEDDMVTCSKNSVLFYESCSTRSEEKRCLLYPGAWHSLLVGEEEPLASQIFEDILKWLEERRGAVRRTTSPSETPR
jgi:caffeoylshikimate esterase